MIAAAISILASALASSVTAADVARPAKPLNVLMIIIDDVAANVHSVGQASPVPTPNIERLAARGTWFNHAYNDAPACCPSRTAMLTGVHVARSGVSYNTQSYKRSNAPISGAETLPANLLRNGYLTASYGKLYHTRDQVDHVAEFTPGYFKMHAAKADVAFPDGAGDPYEWDNIADDPKAPEVKARLAKYLPAENAPDIPEENGGAGDGSRWQDEAFN